MSFFSLYIEANVSFHSSVFFTISVFYFSSLPLYYCKASSNLSVSVRCLLTRALTSFYTSLFSLSMRTILSLNYAIYLSRFSLNC